MSGGGERLHAVEYTRGVAAFMVMWFHFTFRLPEGAAIGFSVNNILSRIAEIPPTAELLVQIAATLALATVFWWLIERPSTLLSKKFGQAGRPAVMNPAPNPAGA
jgi:peptidoglycan/LPS O-acetylase OafA/YrhL